MRVFALLLGLLVFQATAAEKPKIVFIAGDYEYESRQTLPEFARELERDYAVETVVLKRPDDEKDHTIPGLEALETADLAVIFIRRMVLPAAELNRIRKYVDSGKPLVGLRTASHSFLEGVSVPIAGPSLPRAAPNSPWVTSATAFTRLIVIAAIAIHRFILPPASPTAGSASIQFRSAPACERNPP